MSQTAVLNFVILFGSLKKTFFHFFKFFVVLKHHKCACFTTLSWHYCMSRWSLAYAPLPSSHYGQNVKKKPNDYETFLILNQHKFNSDGSNFTLKNKWKQGTCFCRWQFLLTLVGFWLTFCLILLFVIVFVHKMSKKSKINLS